MKKAGTATVSLGGRRYRCDEIYIQLQSGHGQKLTLLEEVPTGFFATFQADGGLHFYPAFAVQDIRLIGAKLAPNSPTRGQRQ